MPKGKKIEPLDLEELENNPSLNGMLAHLDMLPIGSLPVGTEPIGVKPNGSKSDSQDSEISHAISDLSLSKSSPNVRSFPKPADEVISENPHKSLNPTGLTPIGSVPTDFKVPVIDSSDEPSKGLNLNDVLAELAAVPQPPRSRGKIVPATRVEHGHSATQDALYWYLWRAGKSVKGSRSHFIQAGYGQIQAGIGVDRSNVQDAIRELQKKLSIRVVKVNTVGSATIYEIFCCDDILAKRREAKLLWARTFGKRRVELITEAEAAEEKRASPTVFAPIGMESPEFVPPDQKGSVGTKHIPSIGLTPTEGIGVTPIQEVSRANSKKNTTTDVMILREYIEQQIGYVDTEAAERLISECRDRAGNQPFGVDQVISVIKIKLSAARKARNPIGLLIEAVPKHFPQSITVKDELSREEAASQKEYWEQILASPDAPETLKKEAKRLLT